MLNIKLQNNKLDTYFKANGLSLQNLFYTEYGIFPNCYMFKHNPKDENKSFDVDAIINFFKNKYNDDEIEILVYSTSNLSDGIVQNSVCICLKNQRIFARFEKSIYESYILYDFQYNSFLKDFLKDVLQFYRICDSIDNNTIYTISFSSSYGYDLIKSTIKDNNKFAITDIYNDDFQEEDKIIRNFIKEENKSGLVILHGEKGTGKTSYIRKLISLNPDKRFIFVPSGLLNLIGSPDFSSFLLSLQNSIFILEDCENIIQDRKSAGSKDSSISLLLNLSDGLLSDILSIKIICTFNEDIKNIDDALLRKGRLISKYEFKPLNRYKAINLLKMLFGEKFVDDCLNNNLINGDMTLADIFNFEKKSYEIKQNKYF